MKNILKIERNNQVSIVEQICNHYRQRVLAGDLMVGEKLPTLKQLEKSTGICISSIRQSFRLLEKEGIIVKRPRLGTFIQSSGSAQEPSRSHHTGIDLARLRDMVAGIMVGGNLDRGWMNQIEAFQAALSVYGCKSVLIDTGKINGGIDAALRRINAIFYLERFEHGDDFVKKLLDSGLPIVASNYNGNLKISSVREDWGWAVSEILKHLISLGHGKIAMVSYPEKLPAGKFYKWVVEREEAFLEFGALDGLPVSRDDIFRPDFFDVSNPYKMGRNVGDRMFRNFKHDYSAIIATNDFVAAGLYDSALEHGLKIPEDFSLVGFDNRSDAVERQITTVIHRDADDGRMAAEMLVDLYLDQRKDQMVSKVNKPILLIRDSTGPVGKKA
ncbi:MAG TPA: hypothetical protein DET40_15880 [Lentisphaeria bacterium]|nr:MAG: hypothetical protein A2X45_10595 [Lentisphaerae bacterium GWF2_50_93]HCE45020.1 hypothetical protein [Lentisphaeria bacterium]